MKVRSLSHGSLSIWVSDRAGEPATVARLREHDTVVTTALATATPLPLRFGSVFRSDAEALAVLDARRAGFEASLERVRERVEFGLLISSRTVLEVAGDAVDMEVEARVMNAGPGESPSTGREYLERRRKALVGERTASERAEELLREVEQEFADLGVPVVRTVARTGQLIGSLAHLVHTTELRPYRNRVVEVRQRRTDLQIVPSGPWAPYSFV
jgi:hypothetical protein